MIGIVARIDEAYAQAKSLLEKLDGLPSATQVNALGNAGSVATFGFQTALDRAAVSLQKLVLQVEQQLVEQSEALKAAAAALDEVNEQAGVSASQLNEQVSQGIDDLVDDAKQRASQDEAALATSGSSAPEYDLTRPDMQAPEAGS